MEETSEQMYKNPKLSDNYDIKNNEKDAVYQMSEIFGKIVWKSTMVAGVHNKCRFNVSTFANGKRFRGTGTTLKMAKKACALTALANYYNTLDNNEKMLFPVATDLKLSGNKVMIYDDLQRKVFPEDADVARNTLPSTIEEIKDDNQIQNIELKALRNINLGSISNSNLNKNFAKIFEPQNSAVPSNSKTVTSPNICNKENHDSTSELGYMLKHKLKSLGVNKEIPTTSKFSTMELVNVQSVEMKVCIRRSFAKNPLEPQNLLCEEICNYSMVSNQKEVSKFIKLRDEEICNNSMVNNENQVSKFKRPREEDDSELTELPQAKRRAATTKGKWCEQNDNAINYLQNLNPNLKFTLEAKIGTYFMMSVMVGDRKFFGHGKTEFLAKNYAAVRVLNYLENNQIKTTKKPVHSKLKANNLNFQRMILPNTQENEENSTLILPPHISDIIELKIMQRFNQMTWERQNATEYKVLAGIVMTYNMNFEDSTVVSVATGTKCINGGNICCNGTVLNDSHAEVIAKRGLMKFLFAELKRNCEEDSYGTSIFQKNPNSLKVPFRLNPNINFHLYINTAPCGDARVYCFNHISSFKSTQYGHLRTKVEGQLGTKPVDLRYCQQTWDGVVLGEPLQTMSCSDKIALWNVVGIQGALLSQLIDPIYFHSIVLGSLFNPKHMYRAICGRIEHTLGYLPQPYRLHRPFLGQTSRRSTWRTTYKAPGIGMNWTLGDGDIEIISLQTGRTISNEISILSKLVFFSKFNYLCNSLPNLAYLRRINYAEAKANATDFQTSKREVFEAFCRADLGNWIKKPNEQNDFFINWN